MTDIRNKAIQGFTRGDSFTITRKFSQEDVDRFAAITRDYNPIHFDDRFAAVKQFEGRICHGLLVASILTEIGGQIGWLASGMTFQYKKPVYIDDTVTCRLTITDIDDRGRAKAKAIYENINGAIVIEADLTGILPDSEAKAVLQQMVSEGDPTNKCK